MSNTALLTRPRPARHLTALRPSVSPRTPERVITPAPIQQISDAPSAPAANPAVPADVSTTRAPRGFALYVGLDEHKAAEAGVSLPTLVEALRRTLAELAPGAESHATVALAPHGTGGRDIDVVRLALHEPGAVARSKATTEPDATDEAGVVVDISRKRVVIDAESAALTYKEFELLQYLVLREGRTIERSELVEALWQTSDTEVPNERTIDVHVRRLRAKLGRYDEIVRTVRGVGYRFDRHADVVIRYGHGTPSPDRF
ncbi:winged helix-turn-helix domain-containing protein [Microbacterium sp. YY-01]|uniref:winged helix-turn-helix domain-containing protein n=1 Tax=Microbacterium sp. YY-01 TaxID=3421634 RepID=UPI003D16D77D